MRGAIYNSAIPEPILKSVNRALRPAGRLPLAQLVIFLATFGCAVLGHAADWSGPEEQLARKIVAVTGPGAVALTVENRSSLSRRDAEIIQNGLRADLEQAGLRFVGPDQAAASVSITLSENTTSYVWVAEIRQGEAAAGVAMVSLPRSNATPAVHDSMPMALRKTLLWNQDDPILDVAVLEENGTPSRIAVLDAERVSLYRWQGGKWQGEQALPISHGKPWPRDLRGRLVAAKDHLLDVYLPGVSCRSSAALPLALNCRETDDPWPLVAAGVVGNATVFPTAGMENKASVSIPATAAFFAPSRNFFTGAFTPSVGRFSNVVKFYSAALVPREKYVLWFFAAVDGRVHIVDGMNDQSVRFDWGSSIASVKTSCGAGWQVLAASSGELADDSIRAYEFPDRDPVAVSSALDFPGKITEMWTEGRGDTAIVIARNQDTGSYEAYRLAMACSQ